MRRFFLPFYFMVNTLIGFDCFLRTESIRSCALGLFLIRGKQLTFAFILVAYRRRFSMRRRSIFVFVFPPFTSEDRAVISQRTAAALLAIVASAPKSHADFRRNFARRCTARISDYSRGSGPVTGCLRYHQRASSDGLLSG